jgi:hypothetical protein
MQSIKKMPGCMYICTMYIVNTLEYLSLIMLSRQGRYTCTSCFCISTLRDSHHKEGINYTCTYTETTMICKSVFWRHRFLTESIVNICQYIYLENTHTNGLKKSIYNCID